MKLFNLSYESANRTHYSLIREFCEKNDIVVKRMGMDSLFVGQMRVKIECKNKRLANKLQTFIWDELNGGAYCDVEAV